MQFYGGRGGSGDASIGRFDLGLQVRRGLADERCLS